MFLFKRKGVYYLEYEELKTGRKKRISTKKKMKRDALVFISNFKKELEDRAKIKTVSFEQFEKEYIGLKTKSSSVKYIISIKLALKKFREEVGNPLLEDIRFNQAETFIMNIHKDSAWLALLYYRTLKAAFNKAREWDYIKTSPLDKLKFPKIKSNLPLFINAKELDSILENVNDEQLRQFYILALHTGLRLNEILNLRWSAIDFQEKTLKVEHTAEFTTKGKKERIIPLNIIALKLLKDKFTTLTVINIEKNDLLFSKCAGVKLNGDYVSKQFKKALRKTKGINKMLHLHSLRHSFASLMVQKGVSLYVVKDLLGHTDVRTTQIYSHLQQQNFVDAVKVLEN
jgi:site-specific recombinase XerD